MATTAETQLALWIIADTKVANSQKYEIAGRSLTRADADVITKKIIYWKGIVDAEARGGGLKTRRVVPHDS